MARHSQGETQVMNLIDTLIIQLDQALHTLVPGSIEATRPNPADATEQMPLTGAANKHTAGQISWKPSSPTVSSPAQPATKSIWHY